MTYSSNVCLSLSHIWLYFLTFYRHKISYPVIIEPRSLISFYWRKALEIKAWTSYSIHSFILLHALYYCIHTPPCIYEFLCGWASELLANGIITNADTMTISVHIFPYTHLLLNSENYCRIHSAWNPFKKIYPRLGREMARCLKVHFVHAEDESSVPSTHAGSS